MREFGSKDGIYSHIKSRPKREAKFIGGLIGIIYDTADFCPESTVVLKDLSSFNKEHGLSIDPFALCLYGCMLMLKRRYSNNRPIEVVIDQFDKDKARWDLAEEYAGLDSKEPIPLRTLRIRFLAKCETFRNILPLQAADLIAWEMHKLCEDQKGWKYSVEDRATHLAIQKSRQKYYEDYVNRKGVPPRQRKSMLALRNDPALAPQGIIFGRSNIEKLHKRHPNGWASL
jgi:hypothetical protein